MKTTFAGALCALTLSACAMIGAVPKSEVSGIELENFDRAVRLQDDLYRAVNGTWLARTEIPADKSNYGAFTKLDDDAQAQLHGIAEELASKPQTPGSVEQKVGDFYAAFMDDARIEQLGRQPLAAELQRIDALKSKRELPALMAHLVRLGVNVPLIPYVHPDRKQSTQYIGDFVQGGLGLPDRDYYLLDDAKFKALRGAYRTYVGQMLTLAEVPDADKAASAVFALESRLAKAQWDKVANRDPIKTYNKYLTKHLPGLSGTLGWKDYLQAVGFQKLPAVMVTQPSYVKALGRELDRAPLETWKLYFRWQLLDAYAPMLSKPFAEAHFAFHGKTLNGIAAEKPRWRRALDVVQHGNGSPDSPANECLGEGLGRIYVAQHFPPESKARMQQLVRNLLAAYAQEFPTLDWMSPATQKAAAEKLAKFHYKIAYPERWRDYSTLEIRRDDLVGDVMRAARFDYRRGIEKLGRPIDREEWDMPPQAVNAYYNPEMNEIVFPAAILQPPFFNAQADDAVNYGGIGAVIGHEISHGFDDQGSQFDGDGNLRSWWTPADRKKFEAAAARLAAQYDAYEPVKGYHLNGKFTLGENIADLGGLTIAHKAYELSLGGQPPPVLDGYSGEQRFFIGWAQVWRRNYREQNLINRTKTDPHSPSEFRTNGTVVNVPPFYQAFGVKPGDKLYEPPEQRIRIW